MEKSRINIFTIIFLGIMIFFIIRIININLAYVENNKTYSDVQKHISSKNDSEEKEIDVNFEELKKINKDVIGWIFIDGTQINYPILQGKDNEYYLTHMIDRKYNKSRKYFYGCQK